MIHEIPPMLIAVPVGLLIVLAIIIAGVNAIGQKIHPDQIYLFTIPHMAQRASTHKIEDRHVHAIFNLAKRFGWGASRRGKFYLHKTNVFAIFIPESHFSQFPDVMKVYNKQKNIPAGLPVVCMLTIGRDYKLDNYGNRTEKNTYTSVSEDYYELD
jgi:hypothetical protein